MSVRTAVMLAVGRKPLGLAKPYADRVQEFVDFLGKQAPYDALDAEDLERLASHVEVEFFAKGALIIEPGADRLERLAVVRTGLVQLLDRGRVVDEMGPGDTFGHLSVLSGIPPAMAARAATDTLIYLLPDPRGILDDPDKLAFRRAKQAPKELLSGAADYGLRPAGDFARDPLWCRADTPIREAAVMMTEARQSCVLVELPEGLGIVTDSDCRSRVATGEIPVDAPVATIATTPVQTLDRSEPAATAFLQMVQHGVHHLVLADDDGRPSGVCRVVDLASADIRDPLAVRAAIDAADSLDELVAAAAGLRPTIVELFDSGVPALRLGGLLSALIESLMEKCIARVEPFASDDDGRFSWMFMGSLARREPFPGSDVDTGLVWRAPEYDGRRDDVAAAAAQVLDAAEACGLERCSSGANADNPLFNRSIDSWRAAAKHWEDYGAGSASLVLIAMVTDSRPVTGLSLGRQFQRDARKAPPKSWFRRQMLTEAVQVKPPLGFVRDFVVESDGEHRGELHIKGRALYPVVQIGRWVAASTGTLVASTQERLALGAQYGLLSTDEAAALRHAHEELYELVFATEIEALRHGRPPSPYVDPKSLDSLSRRQLRQSFKAIAEVQERLENEWVPRGR